MLKCLLFEGGLIKYVLNTHINVDNYGRPLKELKTLKITNTLVPYINNNGLSCEIIGLIFSVLLFTNMRDLDDYIERSTMHEWFLLSQLPKVGDLENLILNKLCKYWSLSVFYFKDMTDKDDYIWIEPLMCMHECFLLPLCQTGWLEKKESWFIRIDSDSVKSWKKQMSNLLRISCDILSGGETVCDCRIILCKFLKLVG